MGQVLRKWCVWVSSLHSLHPECLRILAGRDKSIPASRIPILAAVGGSMVTRTASRRAFNKEGRAVVTADIIPEIGQAFAEVFDDEGQEGNQGKL
jgi:ATP-dependent NAD(P)H-hydrate dehydratase